MRTFLVVSLGLFLFSGAIWGANAPKLLKQVEAKYAKVKTLSAEFTQHTESAVMGQKKVSSGTIHFMRPDKIRWETLKPDPSLLVSDGKTYWHYTPPFSKDDRGQVLVVKTSDVYAKLSYQLLSGNFKFGKELKITSSKENHFVLKPAKGSAGTVETVEVGVDPKTKFISQVVLIHSNGNRMELNLSKIELGAPLKETEFAFQPPANTDVVKQ